MDKVKVDKFMDNFSRGFKRMTIPAKSTAYRVEFLNQVKKLIHGDTCADKDVLLYIINNAYTNDDIKDALWLADVDNRYPSLKEDVADLNRGEFGIVVGSILYAMVKFGEVKIPSEYEGEIMKGINALQGFRA